MPWSGEKDRLINFILKTFLYKPSDFGRPHVKSLSGLFMQDSLVFPFCNMYKTSLGAVWNQESALFIGLESRAHSCSSYLAQFILPSLLLSGPASRVGKGYQPSLSQSPGNSCQKWEMWIWAPSGWLRTWHHFLLSWQAFWLQVCLIKGRWHHHFFFLQPCFWMKVDSVCWID